MTNEEIVAYQKLMREFEATPLGAAFKAFDSAHGIAWQADERSGWAESAAADRAADTAWKKERATRQALLDLLLPLAGVRTSRSSQEAAHRNTLIDARGSERAPGSDPVTGEYSTAQMLRDEMYGGDTSQPLFD